MPIPQGAILSTPLNSAWICALAEPTSGLAVFIISTKGASTSVTPVATANVYAPGCLALNLGGSSTTTNLLSNSGTAASPTWSVFTIS